MAKGRSYAENLVGPLDRSFYESQRQVAQQANQTNWENLQNQYRNLTDQLKRKQEQANIDFANGLVNVAEGSLNRMANANKDMANRGLTSSGLSNLVKQTDTATKGEQILNLLGAAGDIATATAGQLADSNTNYANKAANLNEGLANTLGDINAGDIAAQMNYNQGLADIGEAMESREADNALQAAQRAASRASSGYNTRKEDEEYSEFMRRVAIADTLADDTLDDKAKENILNIRLGVKNSGQVLEAYNKNIGATQRYEEEFEKLKKAANKANNKNIKINKNNKVNSYTIEPIDYKNPKNLGSNSTNRGGYVTKKAGDIMTTNEQHALDELVKSGITYEELAQLLYGL